MTSRVVVLMLTGSPSSPAAPPRVDAGALAAAMAEDVLTVFAELDGVDEAIAYSPDNARLAADIAWPGTTLLPATVPAGTLTALAEAGYAHAAFVAADVPDVPALHLAKVLSALSSASCAAAPAEGGGLVSLGVQLPVAAGWRADLDGLIPPGARSTPAWHRLRRPADLAGLDPGLDGWEATRAILGRGRPPRDR